MQGLAVLVSHDLRFTYTKFQKKNFSIEFLIIAFILFCCERLTVKRFKFLPNLIKHSVYLLKNLNCILYFNSDVYGNRLASNSYVLWRENCTLDISVLTKQTRNTF